MKKHIKRLLIHLSILIFIPVFYFILSVFLAIGYDLAFRNSVKIPVYWIFILCGLGFILHLILFIFRLYKHWRPSLIRGVISVVSCLLLILIIPYYIRFAIIIAVFGNTPEHVVMFKNEKMVVEVSSWHHSSFNYYDYNNFFVRGTAYRVTALKRQCASDPFKNNPNITEDYFDRYSYYDKEGNLIETKSKFSD